MALLPFTSSPREAPISFVGSCTLQTPFRSVGAVLDQAGVIGLHCMIIYTRPVFLSVLALPEKNIYSLDSKGMMMGV